MKKRYSEEQIIGFLREAENGCVFWVMSATGSEPCRSSIPKPVGPPFRAMWGHDSGACRSIV